MSEQEQEIKNIIVERNITSLYHFTPMSNLANIAKYGFLPRQTLRNMKVKFQYTDEHRLDGRQNCISLSVSFPNSKMFFVKRQELASKDWVVIEIDPAILTQKETLFFPINAASRSINHWCDEAYQGGIAFDQMFGSDEKTKYTQDSQAEVMVKGSIGLKYIKSLHVQSESRSSKDALKPFIGRKTLIKFSSELFSRHPNLRQRAIGA